MTKSIQPRRCSDAFLNRAAQALRILAVPEGAPVATAVAPGRLLFGHVIVAADIGAATPAKPLPSGDIDTVTATLLPGRSTVCTISILHAGRFQTDYRLWARASLVRRELAVLLVQHMPNLAGRAAKGHCHALAFGRRVRGSHFCEFSELNKLGAKAILAAEWAAWLAQEQQQSAK